MSLYEGIDVGRDIASDQNPKKDWDAGLKLLKTNLQLKKATLPTTSKPKFGANSAPSLEIGQKRNDGKFSSLTASNGPHLPFILQGPKDTFFEDLNVEDEYNPLYPNDYERIVKKREEQKRLRREEERKKEAEEKSKRKNEMGSRDSDEDWETDERRENDKRTMGAAIAPPASLIEEPQKDEDDEFPPSKPSFVPTFGSGSKGLNVAAKIMEKYGYKHGAGLGKLEQGMSTALHVEKTGLRGGKIIHEKDVPKSEINNRPESPNEMITDVLKNPTKVVLLKNMVGPGEVDEDLEPEVKEEMQKFGDVSSVVIFEMPGQPDDEAVRIFVEFVKLDHAIKAVVSLHGRFFAGRSIRAAFYDVDKFKQYELVD